MLRREKPSRTDRCIKERPGSKLWMNGVYTCCITPALKW